MNTNFRFLLFFIASLSFLMSCGEKKPDISAIKVNFKMEPFYADLHSINPEKLADEIPRLKKQYGSYLEGYSMRVINVGATDSPTYYEHLKSFIEYQANKDVFAECKTKFSDLSPLRNELEQAYRYYKYYFPKAVLPNVYLQISGFNQSIVIDSAVVGVSVEKYLGASCKFYEWLEYPIYQSRKMVPEKIVPDIMKAIALTEFVYNDSVDDVINNVIYQGMVLHFIEKTNPDLHDTLLFDFTKDELKWCNANEEQMWGVMVENKFLFDNNRINIQKFVGDTPFTSFFGQDSPGRAANWLGYQIVASYLKRYPDITLQQLFELKDGHHFLSVSGYRP